MRRNVVVTVDAAGVINPPGPVTASELSVATSSDSVPVSAVAPASSAAGSVAGLRTWLTTATAGATGVDWGAQFTTSAGGGLAANASAITVTAPAGTFPAGPFVILLDLTTGNDCLGICQVIAAAGGGSVTVTPRFAVAAGDVLELQVIGSTNPGAGLSPASAVGVSTSADTTTVHPAGGTTFTAAQRPAAVTASASTTAATATQTAWTVEFTASATGGIAHDGLQPPQIALSLPSGAAIEPSHDFAVYDLTTGDFQEFAGIASAGGTTAAFFTPAAVSPGDRLVLVLTGVTNPAPGSDPPTAVTVSTTSDTAPASPASGLTFSVPNLPATDLLVGTDPAGSATDDRLVAEFTASPTGALISDAGRWGSITLTAPGTTGFSSGACVVAVDLTTGDYFPCNGGTAAGPSETVTPGFAVGGSDVVEVSFASVTNPPGGLVPPTGFRLSTTSDDGVPSASGDPFTATEGAPATGAVITVNGSCPVSGTITWGDGGAPSPATVSCEGLITELIGTHDYHRFGSYAAAAADDEATAATTSATVSDAALSATPVTGLIATAGAPFSATVATFADANPFGGAGDDAASIDWGDGTTSAGTVTLTTPANGATVTTAQPTFSGAAGTAPGDAPPISLEIYAGGAVSRLPVQSLTTAARGGAWSLTPTGGLANGTYTAQAQQSTSTGVTGFSAAVVFTVKAPPPPPPPPPPGPLTGGGPPAGCATQASFGIIAAVGCLQAVIDPSQIPAAEKAALCTQLSLAAKSCAARLRAEIRTPATAPLLAQALVRVNGLDIVPATGAVVLLDRGHKLVLSSQATVEILGDRVPLSTGPLTLDGATSGDVPALDVNLDQIISRSAVAKAALSIGGWAITGTLGVTLITDASRLTADIALPNIFGLIGGKGLTAQAVATADNQQDVQFNELYFGGPKVADIGGFQLSNLAFCFQNHISDGFCQKKTKVDFGTADPTSASWNVTAKLTILGVTINAVPPPPTYGLGFVNGSFAFAGASASFAPPGVQIASGVFLNSVGGSVALNPTRIRGTVGLTVGDTVTINGAVFMVVPASGTPYTFDGTELGTLIKPPLAIPKVSVDDFAIAAGGSVGLKLPVIGNVPLADGYVLYAYPSYVAVGGGFNAGFLNNNLVIDGGLQGQVNFGNGQFNIEGQAGLLFTPLHFSLQASAVVSNIGIAGCGQLTLFNQTAAAGIGYTWGEGISGVAPIIGSCNLTPWEVVVSASGARAAAVTAVRVRGGLPTEMLKLTGRGGAPDVTITGPGGIRASSAAGDEVRQAPFVIMRSPQLGTTYIAIVHPRAGRYAVTANPGSPAIARILGAHGFTPVVHARVTGRGHARRLVFAARTVPGERLEFLERGRGVDRLIASTRRPRGALPFTPAPGPGGSRQIIALISDGGRPVIVAPGRATPGELVLGSYRAPGPERLGRVRRLRAVRSRRRLRVTFAAVGHARRYLVTLAVANGLRTSYQIRRPRLRATLPGAGSLTGTVTVRALGDDLHTATGPAAGAAITSSAAHRRHRHRRRHR